MKMKTMSTLRYFELMDEMRLIQKEIDVKKVEMDILKEKYESISRKMEMNS